MKSGIIAFSPASIVLFLSFFCVIANASNRHVNFAVGDEPVKSEITSPANNHTVTLQSDKSGSGHAPSAITIVVTHYQFRIANIIWINSAPGLPGIYYIERRVSSSGAWELLKQLPYNAPPEYNDIISYPYCGPTDFSYRVRFAPDSGPEDISESAEISLRDLTSPVSVHNLNVTLLQTASGFNPRLTWTGITNDDISVYEIGRYQESTRSWPIAGTAVADSNAYTDNVSDACGNSYKYIIVTIDKCGNRSGDILYEDLFVQTIKLDVQQPGNCDRIAKLSWNSYHAMPGGLGGYKIIRFDALGTTEKFPTTDTSFNDNSNFIKGHTYLYTVKAYSNNGIDTSASCQVVWPYNTDLVPEVYVAMVSVDATSSYIRVFYHCAPPVTVIKMVLERSKNGTDFQPVDSLLSSGTAFLPTDEHIDDTTADLHNRSYYYRLVAYDDCGGITFSSNLGRSIWLQCTPGNAQNTLNWNPYSTWIKDVENYKIYRYIDGQSPLHELIATLDPATTSYTDLLSGVDPLSSICYYIVAAENPEDPYLIDAFSISNISCNIIETPVFMPNAFRPDGDYNKVLRPVTDTAFRDTRSFKLTIFSRWGQQLFETPDMVKGWDGNVNGQLAPAGLYIYLLTYKSADGKEYSKRGTALLIR